MYRVLDLFSGAGGAAMGLHRAWPDAEITGVDIKPMPRYPFRFVQADAMTFDLSEYDFIWASPPCQGYSAMKHFATEERPKLIADVRAVLDQAAVPYVIENVAGAKSEMINPLMLCGTMFGLRVRRHRLFECIPPIYFAPATCRHWLKVARQGRMPNRETEFICVTGDFSDQPYARRAMGIDWMNRAELGEAIPPAYSEYIARQIRQPGGDD